MKAGGTCAKWRAAGFKASIVCATNGDAGHYEQQAEVLGPRRVAEAAASAEVIGASSEVLDIHDGELQPTLEVRKQIVAIIRRHEADVVITHRPNDYHPDHRYTAQIVQDAAYMVTVPHVVPEVPSLRKNPVFMYFMDHFDKPCPFEADVTVAVDDVMPTKWAMLHEMESQIYEWLAWHDGLLDTVPKGDAERLAWMEKTWGPRFEAATRRNAEGLRRWYGEGAAETTQYAESFEVSEYGHQPSEGELREIFPFLP